MSGGLIASYKVFLLSIKNHCSAANLLVTIGCNFKRNLENALMKKFITNNSIDLLAQLFCDGC